MSRHTVLSPFFVSSSLTQKVAGGPGSGVSHDNTSKIDLEKHGFEKSPAVSLHNRSKVRDAASPRERTVGLDEIDYVAQEKFVIGKLGWFLKNKDEWKNDPIDLLYDGEEDTYHLMDGHHRVLAALRLDMESMPAKVWNASDITGDSVQKGDQFYSTLNDETLEVEGKDGNEVEVQGEDGSKWRERTSIIEKKVREGDWNRRVPTGGKKQACALPPISSLW